jgi:hypothetical protein
VTGREPRLLNPSTCNTRLALYDGPRVAPPRFAPPPGARVDAVPTDVDARPAGLRIGPDVSLVGYDVDWVGEGRDLTADVTLYLRCERATEEWWKVFLHGESETLPGRRAISDHTAVGDEFPSVEWRPGDVVVDHTSLRVGWILDAIGGRGVVTVAMGLFHDETRAEVSPDEAHDGEHRVVVGRYDSRAVPDDAVLERLPDGVAPLAEPVAFGDVATLLAATVEPRHRRGRSALAVTLYLRADRRTAEPWQVFLHAEGAEGRRDRVVNDHHPVGGRLRTTRWRPGAIVVDRATLDLRRVRGQPVRVYAGMFRSGRRASIDPASADAGGDRVLLPAPAPAPRP